MRRPRIKELRSFLGGMVKDLIKDKVPKNQYLDAENMKLTSAEEDTLGAISVTKGNTLAFDLGVLDFATNADDYKAFRITIDNTAPSINHVFTWGGAPISTSGLTYNALKADIIAKAALDGYTAQIYLEPGVIPTAVFHVGLKLFGIPFGSDYALSETIGGSLTPEYNPILKEFYGPSRNGSFVPLKSWDNGDDLYVLSTNGFVTRLGVGKKDESTETWAYTVVFETATLSYDTDAIMDLPGEIDFSERVSVYPTSKGYLPRVIYVNKQQTWTEQFAFTWNEDPDFIEDGNPDGHFTHENVATNSRLQVLENFARVSSNPSTPPTVQNGGSLPAGDKMYIVRQMISDNSSSGWGLSCNPIPIFSDALTNTNLSGDAGGAPTNKSITLKIEGLNPDTYDKFQIAVIENTDGVISAKIIGTYNITAPSGELQTVTHTGNEVTTELSLADIVTQQVLIKDATNAVINRDRLFLSNMSMQVDYNLAEANKTYSTVTTQRRLMESVGADSARVGEYQKPINVYQYTGYMLNETYRLGRVFFFNSGFISSPYFTKDWTCTYATGELTDNAGGTPDNVYVYYPQIAVDFTNFPSIDGVDFVDAVYAYADVRCECIPEILGTGILMPSTQLYGPTSVFGVGQKFALNVAMISPNDLIAGFIDIDALFGKEDITPFDGDILLNYGQGTIYNTIGTTRPTGTGWTEYNFFYEVAGDWVNDYEENEVRDGELVAFNSVGTKSLDGYKYFTEVGDANVDLINNQKSLGLWAYTSISNSHNANPDRGFYYTQYYRPLTNKYGDEAQGKYISCGNFKVIGGVTSHTQGVFGGDTFTQKTIIKFENYGLNFPTGAGDIRRVGVSLYSQNRYNTQMRRFTTPDGFFDYPYTTTSITDWLSGVTVGASQLYEGQLLYSQSYTPVNNFQQLQVFDPTAKVVDIQDNAMYYSDLKISGSRLDAYRYFLPLNRKLFPQVYGAIKNTFRDGNAIKVMMDNAILMQQIDQQQLQQGDNPVSIIIGDGTVLGAREEVLSNFGAPVKTGAHQYLTKTGKLYTAWWNQQYKRLLRHGADGIRDLGEENLLQSFLLANNQYIGAERSINMGFDLRSNELLISTVAAIPGSTLYNSGTTYAEGDIVYTDTISVLRCYYVAKRAVPINTDPSEPSSRLQYWEPYRNSNYTLIFNEKTNSFGGFYSFKTTLFMTYKDNYMTLNESNGVYEHNSGEYLVWYDTLNAYPYINVVYNDYPDWAKEGVYIWVKSTAAPSYVLATGSNGKKTYMEANKVIQSRGYFWVNIYKDATISGSNPNGLNTLHTGEIKGETLEITLFFNGASKLDGMLYEMAVVPKRP